MGQDGRVSTEPDGVLVLAATPIGDPRDAGVRLGLLIDALLGLLDNGYIGTPVHGDALMADTANQPVRVIARDGSVVGDGSDPTIVSRKATWVGLTPSLQA